MIIHYTNYIADLARLARRITPTKALNLLKIKSGFFASRVTGKTLVWGRPFSVSAETAAVCNLKCPECVAGIGNTLRKQPLMDLPLFQEVVSDHSSHAFFANLYFQGEPFLNGRLPQMITMARDKGYYTSLSTNGHFLNQHKCREVIEAGLDHIIISLDGLTQDSYTFYRKGGDLQKVMDGIRTLSYTRDQMKKRQPLIEVQFLVNKVNIGELPQLKDFCRDIGADMVTPKTMQVYGEEGAKAFLPGDEKYNRYSNGKLKKPGNRPCYRLWSHAVYTSDGIPVPCCYDKIPEYGMEVGGQKKPGDYWFSPGMNAFRQKVSHSRDDQEICRTCGE
ncbi:MAG: radical SAM protein [Bacteroidales bacterium]